MVFPNITKHSACIIGCFFLVLAFLALILPIVPATPFLLGSLHFFSRGSTRIHTWLLSLPFMRSVAVDWENGCVSVYAKAIAILIAAGSLSTIFLFMNPPLLAKVFAIGFTLIFLGITLLRPTPCHQVQHRR